MQKLKILVLIFIFVFLASLYQGAVLPSLQGVEYGLAIADLESNSKQQMQQFLMMDVEPNDPNYMDTKQLNLKNGLPIMMRATNVSVILSSLIQKPIWWMVLNSIYMLLSLIVIALGIWILLLVFKVYRSLQFSIVFERSNIHRMNQIGTIVICIGLLGSLIQTINIVMANYLVSLANYKFTFSNVVDFNAIIMGVVILIMSEIMRMAVEMKEEQELTI